MKIFRNFRFVFLVLLLLIFILPSQVLGASLRDVVINEVAWAGTAASTADEWIELYNPTGSAIDLTGWALYEAGGVTLIINLSGSIPSKGYYLVERTDDNTISNIAGDVVGSFGGSGLSNTAENLVLKDNFGNTIDQVDCSGGWFAGSSTGYYTMERIDPCTDGSTASNWASNDGITVNGNDANTNPVNGTARVQNSCWNSSCPGDDTTPPLISATSPDSGVTGVLLTADVIITFNEAMDEASTTAFSISPDPGGHVFSWNAGDTELTVMLNDFTADVLYTVTISTAAEDITGNALDGDGNGTEGPNYVFTFQTKDTAAPDSITDLIATDGPGYRQVTLDWTAVGDDGSVGTATSYILKYSTQTIANDTDFNNADTYTQAWVPLASGNPESYVVDMPQEGTVYYFSIKAVDDSGNRSPFGNTDNATSGDSATSKSPNVKASTSGRVTYTFNYTVISPKFDGDDDFRLVVPAAWGTPTSGNTIVRVDGVNFPGFTIAGQQINASNLTANSSIQIVLGPIDTPGTAETSEFEMYVDVNGGGFVKVTGSPTVDVAEPATITVDPATDPRHPPGTTDIVTVVIRDDESDILYGAHIQLTIIRNPGGDATLSSASLYTDVSGSATFNYRLSSSPGENTVEIICNTLTAYYTDTAFAGNYISQNFPNPFNLNHHQKTTFKINLESDTDVILKIYNINGEPVRTLFDGRMTKGLHEVSWNGTNDYNKQLDAGVYIVYFKYGSTNEKFKMTIIK